MPVLRSTPDHTSLKCRCSNYCCVQFRHVHLTREWRVIRLSKLEINHEQSVHEQNMRVTVDIVFAWMEKKMMCSSEPFAIGWVTDSKYIGTNIGSHGSQMLHPRITWAMEMNESWLVEELWHAQGMNFLDSRPIFLVSRSSFLFVFPFL